MHSSRSKQKYEKSALRISITGSTIFVILEIVMAVITRSQAVLLDSVYDGVEILMVFVSLSLVPLMYKPSSESHPFGYQQIESLFVVVKGAIMIAVTVGLIIVILASLINGSAAMAIVLVIGPMMAWTFTTRRPAVVRPWSSCMNSPATAVRGNRNCGSSLAGTAA